jgi:hypothetical protein
VVEDRERHAVEAGEPFFRRDPQIAVVGLRELSLPETRYFLSPLQIWAEG